MGVRGKASGRRAPQAGDTLERYWESNVPKLGRRRADGWVDSRPEGTAVYQYHLLERGLPRFPMILNKLLGL